MKAARHGNISIGGLVLGVSLTGGSKTEMQLGGRLPKGHFQFGNRQRCGGPAFVTEPCARPSEFQDVCGSGQISQRNPDRPLCISSSALGYKIGLGISPGRPARVSGWRVSVTICVCAGTRHDSRRLAADAICQEEASASFIARHASNWNRRRARMHRGTGLLRLQSPIRLEYTAPGG